MTENPFHKVEAQLAKLVDDVPDESDWLYETKYDGYRILAFVEKGGVRLSTRNNQDYSKYFPEVVSALEKFADERAMVLDGEMIVCDESGKSDFQALQNHLSRTKSGDLEYAVFDILALDGKDLRNQSLVKRKEVLKDLMKEVPDHLLYSKHYKDKGEEMYKDACEKGLEGTIGKKENSTYNGNRDGTWVKVKCGHRQEFVIGGYTLTEKRKEGEVSALLLGVYKDKELMYVGRVGTGIKQEDMKLLHEKFEGLEREESYFKNTPKERAHEKITWLKPKLMAEAQFAEWTSDNYLRQASYKGLREDKDVHTVRKEEGEDND